MGKKTIFDEDGVIAVNGETETERKEKPKNNLKKTHKNSSKNFSGSSKSFNHQDSNIEGPWFEKFVKYNCMNFEELKDNELKDLVNNCRLSFETLLPVQKKRNPSDTKWLEIAIHKGTSKDRANAGALLFQSNPLANLSALQTLISYCKHSNKFNTEVLTVLADLFVEAVLPSSRKLLSLVMRGSDWKSLRKNNDVSENVKNEILAYWHFENELKDYYFDFLKNLQQCMQNGQDSNKSAAIISATKLLMHSPEKEQMLLSMLINKLGDPSSKIASKALHHLTELAYKHPNMCGVIADEAEKLLFRNNISEKAQHFALSFLSQIAPRGRPEVCTKLVNICFSFFKILVQKGAINNKTMQAILRCLEKSIIDAKPLKDGGQLMTKEMQDTIYRLVHLADIKISIQTLSLLLQLITVKTENVDRYYNALYKKLLDLNLTTIGIGTSAQFLHVAHRSIYMDQNISRARAFIKRLLQLSLYTPTQFTCGILIVINKLLKTRSELSQIEKSENVRSQFIKNELLDRFDSDGEEKYEDAPLDSEAEESKFDISTEGKPDKLDSNNEKCITSTSWYHTKLLNQNNKNIKQIVPTCYDPYCRVPAYAGAEYSSITELLLLKEHFHPTVNVFAENILNGKKIDYYGDPLKDFGLTYFLERFSFKNPKKIDKNENNNVYRPHDKGYVPYGTRGQPIKSLTKMNCTEDELFIFNYLEKKRENLAKVKSKSDEDEDETASVDDNEFEDYLDSLCKKPKKRIDEEDVDLDLDYLKELDNDIQKFGEKKKNKKSKKNDNEEIESIESDLGDEDDDASIDMNDNEDENDLSSVGEDISESDLSSHLNEESDEEEPKRKKFKTQKDNFSKTLKRQNDVSSLFAAAEDFSELLEETGKIKGHGTMNAIFNKDKSSDKQLKWEEKRRFRLNKKVNKKKKN